MMTKETYVVEEIRDGSQMREGTWREKMMTWIFYGCWVCSESYTVGIKLPLFGELGLRSEYDTR